MNTSKLLDLYAKVGNKLDQADDHEAMRFLLRARKAIATAIESARIVETPLPERIDQ